MTGTGAVMLLLVFGPLFASCCSNPGYILKEANYIPRNYQEYLEMNKYLHCKSIDQKIVYLLDSIEKKTLVGCFCEKLMFGEYCPELNTDRAQESFNKSCGNFAITPCRSPYNLSESYLCYECFEKFGGILSPQKSQQEILKFQKEKENYIRTIDQLNINNTNLEKELKLLREKYQNLSKLVNMPSVICDKPSDENCCFVFLALFIISMFVAIGVIVYCLCISFLIGKVFRKEKITYKEFLKNQKILLSKLLSSVSDNPNEETAAEKVSNPVPPVSNPPESEASPLLGNINSSEMNTDHDEDPPVTEEGRVDAAVPPVSNPGPPLCLESKKSALHSKGNNNNSSAMHTKQDEDPPVTEEDDIEVETRETVIQMTECPDEQENKGMDIILNVD